MSHIALKIRILSKITLTVLFFFVVLCLMCLCSFADTPNNCCHSYIKHNIQQTTSLAIANLLYNIVTYSIVTYKYKLLHQERAHLINRNRKDGFPLKFQNQNTKACNPFTDWWHSKPLICSLEADRPLQSTEIPHEWQRKVTQDHPVQLVYTSAMTNWHHFVTSESCHNALVKFVVKHRSCSSGD